MNILHILLTALSGIIAGGIVGIVFGFSMASHADVMRGVRPATSNRLILFVARPTSEFRSWESVVFLLLMLVWTAVFFALVLLPAIVAGRLTGDGPPLVLVAYVCFTAATWAGKRFGAHAWKVIS